MDTFTDIIGIALVLILPLSGLFIIGLIFWTDYQAWKARGRPVDLAKWGKMAVNALVINGVGFGVLILLVWWYESCRPAVTY